MLKQLLVILKLVVLTQQLCTVVSKIPNLYTYSLILLNTNLNATQVNYTIIDENIFGSYAIAINQVDIMSTLQWNLNAASNGSAIIVTFKNKFVNWVKISCIILSSQRQDLIAGSATIYFNNNTFSSPKEIYINQSITNYDSSIAFAYLNGFKIMNNSLPISISITAYKVGNNSFGVNIQNANNSVSSITISYLIFSPIYSQFQFYGDTLRKEVKQTTFFDVSQQIPNTNYKFYGFSGVQTFNGADIKFDTTIDQGYLLKVQNQNNIGLSLQYLYFVNENLGCPNQCNYKIINNNTCVEKCPRQTILIVSEDFSFCKACSKQNYQTPNNNKTLCICQEGYSMDAFSIKCLKTAKTEQKQQTSSQSKTSLPNVQVNQALNPFSNNLVPQINGRFATSSSIGPDCSKISNSELINGKCSCKRGYVSLSTLCIAIVQLGTPFSNQKRVTALTTTINSIKASPACTQNQQFSLFLNKCICSPGYKMNSTKCINICSSVQVYNLATNSCICIIGYARINSLCTICISKGQYSIGNEICYPLVLKKHCRNNYIASGGICLSCSAINVSLKGVNNCSVCQNGFIYNGFSCTCPYQLLNGICINLVCGNKKIDQGQTCDDGNTINGDGCSSTCIIEQDYSCSNSPSKCLKNLCGDGGISGGQQCDDNNTISGDGCSSLCLVEHSYTCIGGCISSCYKTLVGNMTVISVNFNPSNAIVVLGLPKKYTFRSRAFADQFIQWRFLSEKTRGNVFCQHYPVGSDRFQCLIIFPSGVPKNGFIMLFRYNYENSTGAIIVDFKSYLRNTC